MKIVDACIYVEKNKPNMKRFHNDLNKKWYINFKTCTHFLVGFVSIAKKFVLRQIDLEIAFVILLKTKITQKDYQNQNDAFL